MRISVNLATRPFVELRRVYFRLRIAMAALLLLGIALGFANHLLGLRAAAAASEMEQVRSQTMAVENERQTSERRMQQPQNRAVLDRSRFLNGLFRAKSFSWTSIMMDLERILPAGVQVTSIDPVVTPEGDINIRLRVSGERERAIELVRNLEHSQRFLNPHLATESAQTQEKGRTVNVAALPPGAVVFDILSGYNPLPEPAHASKASSEPGDGSPRHSSTHTSVSRRPSATEPTHSSKAERHAIRGAKPATGGVR